MMTNPLESKMTTYVGKWDCLACGTKRIPGWKDGRTVERCPICNFPCTKKWYLDDRSMVIGNLQEAAKAKSKRAWTCGHCASVNDADDLVCDACGNPRDAVSDDKVTRDRLYAPGHVPTTGAEVPGVKEVKIGSEHDRPTVDGNNGHTWRCRRCGIYNQSYQTRCKGCDLPKSERKTWQSDDLVESRGKKSKKQNLKTFGSAGIILLILSGFLPETVNVEVIGFSWERQVSIEDYAERSRSDWYSAPHGAYNISSREEIHHYDKVFSHRKCHTKKYVCGTRDNGNGTFSDKHCTRESCTDVYDDVPVHATKYYYNIMGWEHHHYETTSGEDHSPYWGTDKRTATKPNSWREGRRLDTYYTHVTEANGKERKREMEAM